jgi:16S rRNA (adenine1518-N6/adenine1519-N6)-dimethyltransferase
MNMQQADDPERSAVISLLRHHRIMPHKRLGQVFLFKQFIAEEIVRCAAIRGGDVVVEIGSGLGILTVPLGQSGAQIIALEYDSRLAVYLAGAMGRGDVEVIRADALHYDYRRLCEHCGKELIIVGNLPYYLTSPLIFKLLSLRPYIVRLVLMMQREVADRITALPGTPGYGIISILSQVSFQIEHRLTVVKDCFYPLPAVDSEVVVFNRHSRPQRSLTDERAFATLVRVAFAHPRKTLLNAFKACNYFDRGKDMLLQALHECGIDPMRRAHTISIDEYAGLSNTIFPGSSSCP